MTKRVTHDGVVFLHQEETYEVRKNQTGTIQYYTKADTGESGMSLWGLANACGMADRSLSEFLDKTTIFEEVRGKLNIYLIQTDELHVIRTRHLGDCLELLAA